MDRVSSVDEGYIIKGVNTAHFVANNVLCCVQDFGLWTVSCLLGIAVTRALGVSEVGIELMLESNEKSVAQVVGMIKVAAEEIHLSLGTQKELSCCYATLPVGTRKVICRPRLHQFRKLRWTVKTPRSVSQSVSRKAFRHRMFAYSSAISGSNWLCNNSTF